MKLSNSFHIDRPPAEVFEAFLDIERIAVCMPGSRLLGQPEDNTYDGEIKVKVGPLGVSYAGQLKLTETDREQLRITLRAAGREQHGAGNADAHVVAQLSGEAGGTRVEIDTDLSIRGKVAQFGRGVIGEVTDGIIQTFAKNVEALLNGGGATPQPSSSPAATPRAEVPKPEADASLDAWSLIVQPMLKRHAGSLGSLLAVGLVAFLGARAGARAGRRSHRNFH